MSPLLFPFDQYWYLYAGFLFFVLFVLIVDLGLFNKKAHSQSVKEAILWSVTWLVLAMIFNGMLYFYCAQKFNVDIAKKVFLEFFTGFIVEKSLAVDNIFIFAVIFNYFHISSQYQHRILYFGILGALFFRGLFIALGSYLMHYEWVYIVFGVFLVITGLKLLVEQEKKIDPEKNFAIRLLRKIIPVTSTIEGQRFFVRKDKVLHATPLFVALVFLEITDIIFAVDSVPAIFAITKEPFIVFTSNIFAILGLRSLYLLLAGVMDKFKYLKYGLGVILIFVGLKMSWLKDFFEEKFPIQWSLLFILAVLAISVLASIFIKGKNTHDSKNLE
jgi:tellurite resistance protein TerC